MTSKTTRSFRRNLADLPETIRKQAGSAYLLFRENPRHPSPQFKLVHETLPIYSARVSRGYRAVGVLTGNTRAADADMTDAGGKLTMAWEKTAEVVPFTVAK